MKIILVFITIGQFVHETKAGKIEKDIEALEKEKGELFKQINDAIEDSVKSLQKKNDSESLLGISYMNKLKNQLKELNETELNDEDGKTKFENRTLKTAERRFIKKGKKGGKKFEIDFVDVANTINKKKVSKNKIAKDENKKIVQERLDKWLAEREKEKAKIKMYKSKMKQYLSKWEKCPRFGVGTQEGQEVPTKKDGHKYPCCRKCCKKSYMGCL